MRAPQGGLALQGLSPLLHPGRRHTSPSEHVSSGDSPQALPQRGGPTGASASSLGQKYLPSAPPAFTNTIFPPKTEVPCRSPGEACCFLQEMRGCGPKDRYFISKRTARQGHVGQGTDRDGSFVGGWKGNRGFSLSLGILQKQSGLPTSGPEVRPNESAGQPQAALPVSAFILRSPSWRR